MATGFHQLATQQMNNTQGNNNNNNNRHDTRTCNNCGKVGHWHTTVGPIHPTITIMAIGVITMATIIGITTIGIIIIGISPTIIINKGNALFAIKWDIFLPTVHKKIIIKDLQPIGGHQIILVIIIDLLIKING